MFKPIHLLFAATVSFLLISCQKEITFDTPFAGHVGSVNGVLKMKIDGAQWIANLEAGASIMNGYISINGVSLDGKTFTILLNTSVAGTYILNQSSMHVAFLSDSTDLSGMSFTTNQGIDMSDAGGVVTVTSIDPSRGTISGNFHFNMFRDADNKQLVITEGIFERLSYQAVVPPPGSTDTFRVKIDNADFAGNTIIGTAGSGNLFINCTDPAVSETVGLTMPDNITPGAYLLDELTGTYVGLYNPSLTMFLASESGTLTILEHNTTTKRIRGTFNFQAVEQVGTNSANLTQGYFSVKYQ